MRDKEVKQDYRFMPEPNLPPLRLYNISDLQSKGQSSVSKVIIEDIAGEIGKLPQEKRNEMMGKFGISLFRASFIIVSENFFVATFRFKSGAEKLNHKNYPGDLKNAYLEKLHCHKCKLKSLLNKNEHP